MNQERKLSVITITYNDFEGLKKTLDSLAHQDAIESIVINGGACEKTKHYLDQHFGKVVNERDEGIADAFNKGLKHATGGAISFLNSGDALLDRSYYSKAMAILLNNQEVGLVHSDLLFQDIIAGPILLRHQDISLGRGQPFLHPTMVVRSSIFRIVGTFNTKYKIAMDYDHIVRMTKGGVKAWHLPGPVVAMDGTGTSSNKEWAGIMECLRSLKEHDMLGPQNIWGAVCRVLYYLGRKSLQKVGATTILRLLRRQVP
ncbi:MAG: glycosyltransferase [Bdellovibrionota bacterium]